MIDNTEFIPVSKPSLTHIEHAYLVDAYDSSFLSSGSYVTRFEDVWAKMNLYNYGVACNSGTTAMYLALLALGIGPGDEVLVPEFTMVATAWAVTYTGATPVFVDCSKDSTNMCPIDMERKITRKTRAVMPVHVYGRKVDQLVYDIANTYKLYIVEDMAEAHGIQPRGDVACYSFQGNKIITTGEGGMCLTNNKTLAEEMRRLSSLYFDEERTMIHKKVGHNFKMTNMQAAIGFGQVERFDELLDKRKNVERLYNKYLPKEYLLPERDVVWMYDIRVPQFRSLVPQIRELKAYLLRHGIDSRYGFRPMSEQPMYGPGDYCHVPSSHALDWSREILYLPTFPDLTEEQIIYICNTIKSPS